MIELDATPWCPRSDAGAGAPRRRQPRTRLSRRCDHRWRQDILRRAQQLALRVHAACSGRALPGGRRRRQFWGHNAIIRLAPFARHASLPVLPGREPLGGKISATTSSRPPCSAAPAGASRCGGHRRQLREAPPTLVDLASRDRAGAGQHPADPASLRRGFDWLSKVHIAAGVMGYIPACSGSASSSWRVRRGWQVLRHGDNQHRPRSISRASPAADFSRVLTSPKWLAVLLWSSAASGLGRSRVSCSQSLLISPSPP